MTLFETIEKNDPAAAETILAATPEAAMARMDNGVSLLLMAVYYGRKEIARAIRARRQMIDIWEAAALGETASLATLLDGDPALVMAVSPDGFAPLGLAAFFGQPEALALLLTRGADADQPAQNEMRVRPVHSAAANRDSAISLAIMKLLLAHSAEINVAQRGGWTPLHQAADHGHAALVELLLAHGADPAAANEGGLTPRDMAAAKGHDAVLALLPPA